MAEGVERFRLGALEPNGPRALLPDDDLGAWVRYSDYKKLREVNEALRAYHSAENLDRLRAEAQRDQARQEVLEEAKRKLIGLHNGTAPNREERYQDAWRDGVGAAQDLLATLAPSGEGK